MEIKKIITGVFLLCAFASCDIRNSDKKADSRDGVTTNKFADTTTVKIIDSAYNFGQVTDGEKVVFSYRFVNSGDKPLIISSARASCGCTVPEKPEEPIQPGETGYLKIVFNSSGRVGPVHKEVNVVSNANPGFPVLQLMGEVLPANK